MFLTLLMLTTITCCSQITIIPACLTDSTQGILYTDMDNRIQIRGFTAGHIVSISGGSSSITHMGDGRFFVRASQPSDQCRITVSNQQSGNIEAQRDFKVLPFPGYQYNWISGSTITKDSLLKVPYLSLDIPGSFLKSTYTILTYTITIDDGDELVSFKSENAQFPSAFLEHLSNNKNGTIITMDNITVKNPEGRPGKMPFITLYLK